MHTLGIKQDALAAICEGQENANVVGEGAASALAQTAWDISEQLRMTDKDESHSSYYRGASKLTAKIKRISPFIDVATDAEAQESRPPAAATLNLSAHGPPSHSHNGTLHENHESKSQEEHVTSSISKAHAAGTLMSPVSNQSNQGMSTSIQASGATGEMVGRACQVDHPTDGFSADDLSNTLNITTPNPQKMSGGHAQKDGLSSDLRRTNI